MGFYEEEQLIFQKSVERFSELEVLPHLDQWEEKHDFPNEIFLKLGAQGFLGILLDETWGGVGGDRKLAAAWCEAFGKIPSLGFTTAINMHSLVIMPALQRFGSEELKERWLPDGVEGRKIGAYAFTEPGAGSDLSSIITRAVKDGDSWVLNGSKIFITNGARADFVIVLAKTDPEAAYDGYSSFVVDSSLPGFSVNRKLDKIGWHCSDTAELSFSDLRIPATALLGEEGRGWYQSMASLEWERLMLSLNSLAGAKQCLEDSIQYISERKVFGKTLDSFDLSQQFVLEMKSILAASEASSHRSLSMLLAEKKCRKEVSLTKLFVCEEAIKIADRCLQLHGGYGYTTELKPERWLRDLRLNTIGGGTSEIMARIAAKDLIGDQL